MLDEMQEPKMWGTEDYWAMLRRQRWVILAAAFVCWLLVWGVSWLLPSSYESDAVVQIQQQQVSPKLVEPNSLETTGAQLEAVREQVLNPSSLQGIIDSNHLYPRNHGVLALFQPSDPVQKMEKDIQVSYFQAEQKNSNQTTLTDFQISYTAPSPEVAQVVDRELTNLFVTQNNTNQLQTSQTTTSFLKTEVGDAQNELNQQEVKVKEFKAQHMGELPDQVQGNLQVLSGLQQELENNERALSGAREQRLYLESIVQQYQTAQSDLGTGDSAVAPSTLDTQLKDLEMQLAQERSQYTDNYPDVIALKDQIAKTKELKKQSENEIAAERKSDSEKASGTLSPGTATEVQNGSPTPMMQIESQLKSNQLQIQSLQAGEKNIEAKIDQYQVRLEAAPKVEQELSEISRGYTEASSNYDTLRQKWQDSELASNFPQGQQGLYSIASPPTFPVAPSAPNHLLISLAGLGAGIAIGLGLGLLWEFTNVRIYKESDLEGVVSARVLVGIPKLSTAVEERRRIILRWVERGAVLAMVVIVLAGNVYAFLKG
jgi:polysaccharide biosynthesis transport protein